MMRACIMRISILEAKLVRKKCTLYTGKYGNIFVNACKTYAGRRIHVAPLRLIYNSSVDCEQSLFFLLSSSSRGKTSRTPARGNLGKEKQEKQEK